MTLSETTSFNDQEHAEDLIKDLIEDGHDKEEMEEFIKTHGHKDFVFIMKTTHGWWKSMIKRQSILLLKSLTSWTLNTYRTHTTGTIAAGQNLRNNL